MNAQRDWKAELARCREIAGLAERSGDARRAVEVLRRAADMLRHTPDENLDTARALARGEVCGRLGELLWDENLPAAIQAYQQAVDSFALTGLEGRTADCARRVVEGVRLLRYRPAERLDLLIARYDQELRVLVDQTDSKRQQAELEFKVATVLQRRDRFEDAAERYRKSLALFGPVAETELLQAQCHHRLADLLHHELRDDRTAADHYRHAVRLYGDHEAESEGEQMNRALCEWHLLEVEQRLGRQTTGL